jgi:hypothetical protein
MSEAVVDDIVAVLPPLLQSLEALGFVARYLNPPDFDRVMERIGQPDEALRAERPRLEQWSEQFAAIKTPLETASDAALAAFEALRVVQRGEGEFVSLFRGLRYAARAAPIEPCRLRPPYVQRPLGGRVYNLLIETERCVISDAPIGFLIFGRHTSSSLSLLLCWTQTSAG